MTLATRSPRTAGTAAPAPRRRPWRERMRRVGVPYLFLLPALLLELLIHIGPMLVGVGVSFLELTRFFIRNWSAAPFAGLANYKVVVQFDQAIGKSLLESFAVTVAFTLLTIGLAWAIGFVAAILLQARVTGRGFFRMFFLVPYALPIYAAVITWSFMLQRDSGAVNHLLVDQLGVLDSAPFWLLGNNAFVSLVVVAVWRMWPFAFLMIMAALQTIPGDLYEAAAIDGAGIGQQIRRITLPMLRPVNLVLILVLFLWTFNDFNTPYILFGASPPAGADIISLHIYNSSFVNWDFGVGSAMSVLLLIFLLVVSLIYLRVTRRKEDHAV